MRVLFLSAVCAVSVQSFAVTTVPDCIAGGQIIAVNNTEALDWKTSKANQFHGRAHVAGKLQKIYGDHGGHHHFELLIGANAGDTIEVVYNDAFGVLPTLTLGETVEACGDYIVSNAPSGKYPASPDGALIHWVHKSPSSSHESGYMVFDGVIVGQDSASGGGGHHGTGTAP